MKIAKFGDPPQWRVRLGQPCSAPLFRRDQGSDEFFEAGDALGQGLDVRVFRLELFLELLVEALDGREGDAVGVNGRDGAVVFAKLKGSVKVLSGGADVADRGILRFVIPGGQ